MWGRGGIPAPVSNLCPVGDVFDKRAVEQSFVPDPQRHHEDVSLDVGGFSAEVPQDPVDLDILRSDTRGQEAAQTEAFALGARESRRLVQCRILEAGKTCDVGTLVALH